MAPTVFSRLTLVVLMLAVISVDSPAQDPDDPIAAIRSGMQSPTAASLGRHGDLPVNLHTGSVSVSIPLFEVQGHSLSLPITLQYHGTGVKVSETAGWVGTGWSLEAGGVITRSVRGLPDDDYYGYPATGHRLMSDAWPLIQTGPVPPGDGQAGLVRSLLVDIHNGNVDPEPDRFFFTIPGHSGQFIIPPDLSNAPIRPIPYAPITIARPQGPGPWQWELMDTDGTTYVFTDNESTTILPITDNSETISLGNDSTHDTSWFLSTMTSPTGGDQISFNYTSATTVDHSPYHHTRSHPIIYHPNNDCDTIAPNIWSYSQMTIQTRILDSIQTSSYFVQFHTSLRDDALNPNALPGQDPKQHVRLDSISVYRGDQSGSLIRQFNFQYEYFGTDEAKRLFLTQVIETGNDGSELAPYTFQYYEPEGLPSKSSTDQDHWGYYNSANNDNAPNLPSRFMVPETTSPFFPGTILSGVDRDPSQRSWLPSTYGVLSRVTYPTGGSTDLHYDYHTYSETVEGPAYTPHEVMASGESVSCEMHVEAEWTTVPFSVTRYDGSPAPTLINYNITPNHDGTNGVPIEGRVEIIKDCGTSNCELMFYADYCAFENGCSGSAILPDGDYEMRICSGGTNIEYHAYMSAHWDNTLMDMMAPGGGARIERVEHYTADSTPSIVHYEYDFESDGTYISSGRLVSIPEYDLVAERQNCHILRRTSAPRGPLGTTQGSHIGYTRVREIRGEGLEGSIDHTFNFHYDEDLEADSGASVHSFAFNAATSQSWRRGQPLERIVRDNYGFMIERTAYDHQYSEFGGLHFYPFRSLVVSTIPIPNGADDELRVEYFGRYHVISAWARLKDQLEIRYDTP